jgi:hypothetical protein
MWLGRRSPNAVIEMADLIAALRWLLVEAAPRKDAGRRGDVAQPVRELPRGALCIPGVASPQAGVAEPDQPFS